MYDKVRQFIEPGSEISSAAVGAAIGSVGGVQGAIVGAMAAPVLKQLFVKGCTSLGDQVTGYRAKARAGLAAAYTINEINSALNSGSIPRVDDFFDDAEGRSSADEILEGVILKVKDEYEERKAKFIANILVTGIFDESFSRPELNHLLRTAEQLTYRQVCLLSLFGQKNKFVLPDSNYAGAAHGTFVYGLVMEVLALARRDLIELRYENQLVGTPLRGFPDFNPHQSSLTSEGQRLFTCMKLDTVEDSELKDLLTQFKYCSRATQISSKNPLT